QSHCPGPRCPQMSPRHRHLLLVSSWLGSLCGLMIDRLKHHAVIGLGLILRDVAGANVIKYSLTRAEVGRSPAATACCLDAQDVANLQRDAGSLGMLGALERRTGINQASTGFSRLSSCHALRGKAVPI